MYNSWLRPCTKHVYIYLLLHLLYKLLPQPRCTLCHGLACASAASSQTLASTALQHNFPVCMDTLALGHLTPDSLAFWGVNQGLARLQ